MTNLIPTDPIDVQSPSWESHVWSEWHSLSDAISPRNAKAPDGPGLHRIRSQGQRGLIYIGETGDSLRSRFRQLQKAMEYAQQGKYAAQGKIGGPPHVAGGCIWNHKRTGIVIKVSWMDSLDLDTRDRKGVECELIAAYRKTMKSRTVQRL